MTAMVMGRVQRPAQLPLTGQPVPFQNKLVFVSGRCTSPPLPFTYHVENKREKCARTLGSRPAAAPCRRPSAPPPRWRAAPLAAAPVRQHRRTCEQGGVGQGEVARQEEREAGHGEDTDYRSMGPLPFSSLSRGVGAARTSSSTRSCPRSASASRHRPSSWASGQAPGGTPAGGSASASLSARLPAKLASSRASVAPLLLLAPPPAALAPWVLALPAGAGCGCAAGSPLPGCAPLGLMHASGACVCVFTSVCA